MNDMWILLGSLTFKFVTALAAFLVALVVEAYFERRRGNFRRNFTDADAHAKAVYLGARRIAVAVLVGLAIS